MNLPKIVQELQDFGYKNDSNEDRFIVVVSDEEMREFQKFAHENCNVVHEIDIRTNEFTAITFGYTTFILRRMINGRFINPTY